MKVLIYINDGKAGGDEWRKNVISLLSENNIEWEFIKNSDLKKNIKADALFVYGGDGTILHLNEFSGKNNIPILGINAGKLGFLSEFEKDETEIAIKALKNGELIKDARVTLKVKSKNKVYNALNDAVLQRIYTKEHTALVVNVKIIIDNNYIDDIVGDGVIVSTPTGSTAYSLSAGGAIMTPEINAFSLTPISAHSLHVRPIVYSSDSTCILEINEGSITGLFIDGMLVDTLGPKDNVFIEKSDLKAIFYRKKDSNFFTRLATKFKNNGDRLKQ